MKIKIQDQTIKLINNIGVGVDIEKTSRFDKKLISNKQFLNKVFTKDELNYCLKHKNPSPHLTARFCAKEAVFKALSQLSINFPNLREIEIVASKNNFLEVKINSSNLKDLKINLSISHTLDYAVAFAIVLK